jgi:hypothetical protein
MEQQMGGDTTLSGLAIECWSDGQALRALTQCHREFMSSGMNIQQIRRMVTNGFKPFTLHLSDGRKCSVPHPEFVAVGRSVVVVIGKDDQVNTLDPLHIVSLEQKLAHT